MLCSSLALLRAVAWRLVQDCLTSGYRECVSWRNHIPSEIITYSSSANVFVSARSKEIYPALSVLRLHFVKLCKEAEVEV